MVDHLAALTPRGGNAPQLPLGDIFIPQLVRADPPAVELPHEVWQRLINTKGISEQEFPKGLDRRQVEDAFKRYAQRPQRPVFDVVSGLAGCQKLVLLGYPGAGKSTLAKYLMLALAVPVDDDRPLDGHPLGNLAMHLPVLVELRTYVQHSNDRSFLDQIDQQYVELRLGMPRRLLEPYLDQGGQALVIFDGLDEVFDPALRDEIKRRIDAFADRYPRVRVIVTSRVTDYDRNILDAGGFGHYLLQDLSLGQITEFADRFYHAAYPNDEAEAGRLTARLLDAVADSPAVAELAGNPMLLTILAIIGRGQELPRERRTAYEHAVSVLVERWDAIRQPRRAGAGIGIAPLNTREKLELLRLVARYMQEGAGGLAGNSLPETELAEMFATYFEQEFEQPPGEARRIADALIDQFRERDYILARFGTEVYGFVHRAFLDYLAADDIYWQFSHHEINASDIVSVFRDRWCDPAWQEVQLLLAGMIPEQIAAQAVDELLRVNPLWYQGADPVPQHVLLAIRCLGEVRRRGRLTQQSRDIATALISLLEMVSDPWDFDLGPPFAQALEREVLPTLAEFGRHWAGRQRYEAWYLTRGQFLGGSLPSFAQAAAARVYLTLLGRDASARDRLHSLSKWADSQTMRAAAIETLAVGWQNEPRTRQLIELLATEDQGWYVRQTATYLLAGRWPTRPTWLLLRHLAIEDPAPGVRGAAIRALTSALPDAETIALLRMRADIDLALGPGQIEPHAEVRATAVQCLATLWHDDPAAEQWLIACFDSAEHPLVRTAALQAIAARWHRGPATAQWLGEVAASEPEPEVTSAAIRALVTGWHEDPNLAALLKQVAADDEHRGADVRRAAVEALAVGWRDDATAGWLRERAVAERDGNVQEAVVRALAATWGRQPATVELFRQLARDRAVEWYVRAGVVQALADICRDDPDTVRWLQRCAADDESWYVRRKALRAVAAGWPDQQTASWLRKRADADSAPEVRGAAVQSLAAAWRHDAEIFSWLRTVGGSDPRDGYVRQAAMQAVATWWHEDEESAAWLRERSTDDPRFEVRWTAVQLLAAWWHDDDRTVDWLRECFRTDLHPLVRRAVVRALSAGWPENAETALWLREKAFADPDQSVRLAVIRTIATDWHEHPATLGWLAEQASDADRDIRIAAVRALARGWSDDAVTGRWLRDLAAGTDDEAVRAAAAGQAGGDD
jgi:hypothetical protein